MTKLLLNEKLDNKFKQSKETESSAIIKLFRRIVSNNKLLFFNCSLLAILTAVINTFSGLFIEKLISALYYDPSVVNEVSM